MPEAVTKDSGLLVPADMGSWKTSLVPVVVKDCCRPAAEVKEESELCMQQTLRSASCEVILYQQVQKSSSSCS